MLHEEFVRQHIPRLGSLMLGRNGFIYHHTWGSPSVLASNTEWNNWSDMDALIHTAHVLGISPDELLKRRTLVNQRYTIEGSITEPRRRRKLNSDPAVAGKKTADLWVAFLRTDAPLMSVFKLGMFFADVEQFTGQDAVEYAEQWANTFAQYNHANAPMAIESARES